ncbi:unnamed protein product [Discula destructiva]
MESAKYHQLSDLPEPDYFEIELEKIYGAPPTRLSRLKQWARRNIYLIAFSVLFIVAAVLYISAKTAQRPRLLGILRPDSSPLRQAALADESQIPDGLWSTPPPGSEDNGDEVTIDVAGADVNNIDEDDVVLDVPSTNSTIVVVSPAESNDSQEDHSSQPIEIHQDPDQNFSESPEDEAPASKEPAAAVQTPTPKPSDKPVIQEDTGQVTISEATPEEEEPFVPIRATFYSSVEGPKACRGHPIAIVDLPKPQALDGPTERQCYNFAKKQTSDCALFMANKVDGCIANVYAEPNCLTYTNTLAFMAEERPVGGHWRSFMLQCGLPEPDPATLGQPPMMDQMTSLVDHDKEKEG